MLHFRLRAPVLAFLGILAAASAASAQVPPEDVEKIRLAAPPAAPVVPRQPRKILVFSAADGFVHDSIPWGAEALRVLGEKSGAYVATLTSDPAMFERTRLQQFDAVVMNNNCGNPIAAPERRTNLLQFVRSGGGLVGIHCAAHLDWPEYVEMLGGYSKDHPWTAGSTVAVRPEEHGQVLTQCFAESSFLFTDEIFRFEKFSRDKSRVLLSIDPAETDLKKPGIAPGERDFPLSWIRNYGQGRVFYSAFGHQKDAYWHPALLRHLLAGIQFALGDLAADASPRHARSESYRPQFHFTYQQGWLSDINGLLYYRGQYHLFSQHCPASAACDYPKTHWGHAISDDLVHWRELAPALAPDQNGPIFSGSAAVDWHNTSGFQTSEEIPLVACYTAARYILSDTQDGVLSLAYSNDRGHSWNKYARNPVLGPITHFNRDPKIFWHEPSRRWIMAITLSCGGWLDGDYRFALFSSPDLKTWKEESRLEMPKGIDCPDLFCLPVDGNPAKCRWVFWAGDGTYAVGTFDGKTFSREGPIRTPSILWTDNGSNGYAAQTFSNLSPSDQRTIQIAWLRHGSYPGMPFNQQASFPCELRLDTTPAGIVLARRPIREIQLLHDDSRRWTDLELRPGQNPLAQVRGGLFDIRAELAPGATGHIRLVAYGVPVDYDAVAQTVSCGGKSIKLAAVDGPVKLQFLVDRTSLEIFANDGLSSMTYLFLPVKADAELAMVARDAPARIVSLEVHHLHSIWPCDGR